MEILDEGVGEIRVVRDALRAHVAVHIKQSLRDDGRVVRLTRQEARRLAALLLYQAERLSDVRLGPAAGADDHESNCA
jgi:hypothetical protein